MENLNKIIENETEVQQLIENESMAEELTFKTVKANIDNEVKDIILGYSEFNMERPKGWT